MAIFEMGWIDRPFGHMRNGMFMNGMTIQWREEKGGRVGKVCRRTLRASKFQELGVGCRGQQ